MTHSKKKWTAAAAFISTAAVVASLGSAGMAFASATTDLSDINDGAGAKWSVPTSPMTNTVWKDSTGKVVPANTKGATQYKVLTTWAEAWSTAGPDFLGISNSAYYGNGGNGNAKVTNYTQAEKNSMVGVWATSANENPNAYNWNTFYNFYAEAMNKDSSDWTTASTTTNGGSDWDSASGVWCGFKYRPEIIWLNNNLNATATQTYVKQINDGQYSATGTKSGSTYTPDAGEGDTYDSSFAVYGDSSYDPTIIQPNNNSPYSFVESMFQLADSADKVIKDSANNPGLSSDESLNWKTVNKLPRSSRYTETPEECALNIEELARGSVYYTLDQINKGNVKKKKVAYVAYPPSYSTTGRDGTTTTYTNDTQVIVASYDYTENIGSGPMDGRASWSPLTVNQLSTKDIYKERQAGTTVSGSPDYSTAKNSTTTFTLSYATADDLASCDVIYSPQNSTTAKEWQEWIEKNASPANAKKAADISYVAASPAITNGSNYTIEKLIYGAYALDSIYPELFKNMELTSFWYNKVWHIKAANLAESMSWGLAKASLPSGTSLASIGTSYDATKTYQKFETGYQYFQKAKGSDATLKRVLANQDLDGKTGDYAFNGFEPSTTWVKADHSKYATEDKTSAKPVTAKKSQKVKIKTSSKTVKYKKVKKAKATFKVSASAKTKISFAKKGGSKKLSISKAGKVTVKKGTKKGTYKIKVKASAAASSTYKSASATKTIKVKVK